MPDAYGAPSVCQHHCCKITSDCGNSPGLESALGMYIGAKEPFSPSLMVLPGLVPGIHGNRQGVCSFSWVAGSSLAKTREVNSV
jgi:hypothetical protein